jgi:hypothetical protein
MRPESEENTRTLTDPNPGTNERTQAYDHPDHADDRGALIEIWSFMSKRPEDPEPDSDRHYAANGYEVNRNQDPAFDAFVRHLDAWARETNQLILSWRRDEGAAAALAGTPLGDENKNIVR